MDGVRIEEDRTIYVARKCPECGKKMEVGERFAWKVFRFRGKEQTLPIHLSHATTPPDIRDAIANVKRQAAINGSVKAVGEIQLQLQAFSQSFNKAVENVVRHLKQVSRVINEDAAYREALASWEDEGGAIYVGRDAYSSEH